MRLTAAVLGQFLANLAMLTTINAVLHANCDFNETSIVKRPVMKTRTVVVKPKGLTKIFRKTKTYVETYEDVEEDITHRLIKRCCAGYEMLPLSICVPICAPDCPRNARCVEPNRCQCEKGYVSAVHRSNGTHYCEPVCVGCPENGQCTAPNVCECRRGYVAEAGSCLPYCPHGCPEDRECVRPDTCECRAGFEVNPVGKCLPICANHTAEDCIENLLSYTTEIVTLTSSEDDNTDIIDDDLDESEKIFLDSSESDFSTEATTATSKKCASGFIFYHGKCHARVFSSNEVDCRFKPCAAHAVCQENGTCACSEGYTWFMDSAEKQEQQGVAGRDSLNGTALNITSPICVSAEEVLVLTDSASMEIEEEGTAWEIVAIVASVLMVVALLAYVAFKVFQRNTGHMEVKAKSDLSCAYDTRSSEQTHMVL